MRPIRVALPTPFAVGPVNAYLLPGDPVTLVDPGPDYAPAVEALGEALKAHGLVRSDVRRIVVTHYHPDHAGYAPRLAQDVGAELFMHPETARRLDTTESEGARMRELLQRHGVPGAMTAAMEQELRRVVGFLSPLRDFAALRDGERIEVGGTAIEAVLTPGHASGHLALMGPDFMLGGDLLIRGITPNPVLEVDAAGRRVPSLPQYLESVERVRQIDPGLVLPGHRGEIREPALAIAQFSDEVALRQEAVAGALSALGETDAYTLSQKFFPVEGGADPFLALGEILGHLDLLVRAGRAEWHEESKRLRVAARV